MIPCRSPYSLLQEDLWSPNVWSAWRMLVVCIMLNCTQRKQVERVIPLFFAKWSQPSQLLAADDHEIADVCRSLGFANRRTALLKKMSHAYINTTWTHVKELPGVGEYAARSWEIFYKNDLGETEPKDHALVNYWRWAINNRNE